MAEERLAWDPGYLPGLLRWQRPAMVTVTVGHSRDAESVAAAARFVREWEALGGVVHDVVDWPEEAASWLRQARRFAAGQPDAWVVIAEPEGWTGMRERLLESTDWDPDRTFTVTTPAHAH